jgi:DNA-binding transcriptional ArsR family regulator
VQDISVGTSQSNFAHLAILRDKGVLQTRKDANRVFYRIADQRTLQLIALMREVFCGVPAHRE